MTPDELILQLERECDRLRGVVAEFREREKTQDQIRERLTTERDRLAAQVQAVRKLIQPGGSDVCVTNYDLRRALDGGDAS